MRTNSRSQSVISSASSSTRATTLVSSGVNIDPVFVARLQTEIRNWLDEMAVAQTCRPKARLRTSRRKSGTNRLLDRIAEHIDLRQCRIDVRRDSDALEFFVLDRCDDDSIALPQMT